MNLLQNLTPDNYVILKGIDRIRHHPKTEVDSENAGITNPIHKPTLRDEDAYLRNKYTEAALIAMRLMYDDWSIHNYEYYQIRQENDHVISDQAPNGDYYEKPDILAKKSKEIDRDEAIKQLKTTAKYAITVDWSKQRPNYLHLIGPQMNFKFRQEQYEFIMEERKINFKRISSLLYDQLRIQVYKKSYPTKPNEEYTHAAVVNLYYYSGSRYIRRYTNLFNDEGRELIDPSHYDEYMYDTNKRTVDITEDDAVSALTPERLSHIGNVQLHYSDDKDTSDTTFVNTY